MHLEYYLYYKQIQTIYEMFEWFVFSPKTTSYI